MGTDPYQIPERILGGDYQNPITEDTEETGNFGVDVPNVPSRIHSDYDSLKMENYEKCWLHRCIYMGEEKLWFFSKTHSFRATKKRGATAQRTPVLHSRRESLNSNSSQEPRASGKPDALFFIKERRTGKSVQEFYVQMC